MISGSWLKVLAMLAMVVDHTASRILYHEPTIVEPLLTIGGKDISWLFLMRCFGRLAFPLFAFLLVEGFLHTHSRWRYGRNLLVFALLSEIPYDLLRGDVFPAHGQNVLFTLLLGFLTLTIISWWEQHRLDNCRLAFYLIVLIVCAHLINCDYGSTGVSFVILLYVLRHQRILQAAIGCTMLPMGLIAGLAFVPINLYNGRRGFIHSSIGKYFFYAFYPLHLIVLYLIKSC